MESEILELLDDDDLRWPKDSANATSASGSPRSCSTTPPVISLPRLKRIPWCRRDARILAPGSPVCVLCVESLTGKRRQARYCGPDHSAEAARLRAILQGSPTADYASLAHRFRAARKRTVEFWEGVL